MESQASAHRALIANAEQSATGLDALQADLSDVSAEVQRLEAEQARRDELRDQIAALSEEKAGLKVENTALREEMDALKARIDQLQEAEAVCPLCGQPLEPGHKATLLEEITAEGKERGDAFRANVARSKQIDAEIAEHREAIAAIDQELRRLPPLRDKAAQLQASIEAAHTAADTIQAEQSELRAIEAALEAGDYARELQAQRDALQAEIDALGYDSGAHDEARQTVKVYSDYERRQRDLEAALQQLPETEQALENAQARRIRWEEALEDERKEAAAARAEIEALQGRVEEARRREQELRERKNAETRAREARIRAEQALQAIEHARERKRVLEERRAAQAQEQAIYEDLRDAFGKNGVPAMIIEAAIPELEQATNQLLARMTGGRMHVRLDTQREKKKGGVIETLDILISDELGTRSYESYSGGEAFRVNFAIRVALSQLLARRAGAQLRTLFIDEGFGTQDEDGRQRLIEAITSVEEQFDLLLVITHIEVTKTPDGSRVSMR